MIDNTSIFKLRNFILIKTSKLNYIKRYINNEKRASGPKASLLDVIRRLWSFAVEEELFGDVPPVIDFTSLIGSLKNPLIIDAECWNIEEKIKLGDDKLVIATRKVECLQES